MFSSSGAVSNLISLQLQSVPLSSDISALFNNNLRTTIKASDKNQDVDLFLLSQDYSFFITQNDKFFENNDNSKINKYSNNFYNYQFSSSLHILSNRTKAAFTKYKFASKAEENFIFCGENKCEKNSINVKNLNFMLAEDPFDKISGGIGLAPLKFIFQGEVNLFNELYNEKYINYPVWFIDYEENGVKKLVIGKFPYEINHNLNQDNYEFVTIADNGNLWEVKAVKIQIGYDHDNDEEYIIKEKLMIFEPESSSVYGPREYYIKIKNIFFAKFFSNNKCKENTYNHQSTEYLYISCDDDLSLKDFPPLVIDINNNIRAELTYEDLFIKNNGQILFLFVTDKIEKYSNDKWYMGDPFLKKYKPVYNQKNYKIGFYEVIKKNRTGTKFEAIFSFVIFSITIFVVIYLCLYIFRKYRNRKIRKAALEMKIEEISSKLILNNTENK